MKRRSQQDWLMLFEQQAASGLSAATFCQEQSLCPHYFSKRKRELCFSSTPTPVSAFVKLAQTPAMSTMDSDSLELRYQSVRLSMPLSVDTQWLARLLQALS